DLESVGGAPNCTGLCGVFFARTGPEETQVEASFRDAIRIAKEQKSVSLEKRAEGTCAEYHRKKRAGQEDVDFEYLFGNMPAAPRFLQRSQLPGCSTTFSGFVFVIDLLAANCPASVSSVRQLLSWRLSNHTVYGAPERQLFYSF